jgi:1,2-phenylacetyl-CoA epoxidase PaaB subunit
MNERLNLAIDEVRRYLEDNQYSYSMRMSHYRCYRLVDAYRKMKAKDYNAQLPQEMV